MLLNRFAVERSTVIHAPEPFVISQPKCRMVNECRRDTVNRPLQRCVLFLSTMSVVVITLHDAFGQENATQRDSTWISALDQTRVKRIGQWQETRFRYAAASHLLTNSDGAALECRFRGSGIVMRLGNHAVPAYGVPNLGSIAVMIDGQDRHTFAPRATPREAVIARGLDDGDHVLRVEHLAEAGGTGGRIEGFYVLDKPTGDLQFIVSGEENAFLVDARAVLRQGDRIIRSALVRNWLTGQCSLAGLPPGDGYSLELSAIGWNPTRIDNISVEANKSSTIGPIFLHRDEATRIVRFRFPALNRPAIRRPGQTFRARFLGFEATIDEVQLRRTVGPAVISRQIEFEEDKAAAYYYDREIITKLPHDMPPGVYDLSIKVTGGHRTGFCLSPCSVHVVPEFPVDPVLVTFGHLDTSGQYQAEYLERLVSMINLIAPDIVLNSNAVNPAYISGALSRLDMPYVINFGNHQFHGHEKWYGDPVGLVDFGPDLCVLNFGHPWHVDRSRADSLLVSRADWRHKIINAFEANAPTAWLDKHKVCMIHDAHGIGKKVTDMGATPTRRIGKVNAVSFHVVRFKDGRVASCTYNGHETAPIPFGREQKPPLRVRFSPANDGNHRDVTATVTNEYAEDFPECRLTFVMPHGDYVVDRGRIESSITSDDKKYTAVSVRTDIPAEGTVVVRLQPAPKPR